MQGSRSDCAVVERSMLERATANRQPVSGTFELTARCNLACGMCYIRKPANDRHERSHELTAAQWVDVTQQAVGAGMVFLTLTGGEILIRKDFFDLYEPMTQMGLVITLFTNATAITPAVAKRLAQSPPSRVEISLYGASEAAYERVTGTTNAYDKCLRGIRLLADAGVNVVVKSTLTKYNAHELDLMKRMAAEWGVRRGATTTSRRSRTFAARHGRPSTWRRPTPPPRPRSAPLSRPLRPRRTPTHSTARRASPRSPSAPSAR
jgi:MoaA/NifB/PqqE/SkfB family radical SAM enzyme